VCVKCTVQIKTIIVVCTVQCETVIGVCKLYRKSEIVV